MPTPTQLNFILSFVDRMTKPAQGACKSVKNALDVANSGFNSMKNGALGVASSWYTMQKMVNPAHDYYKALGEVKSLSVAQTELDKLGNSAMEYAQKYGGGVSAFIRSAYDIQSAITGLADGELASFTHAANITAKATKATADEMTNYLGTMYGVFEKDATHMGKAKWADDLMGKTALAVKMFKTTGSGMSAAFTNIGASATQMGYSLNEQIGVLGSLQSAMPGERAGTAYASFVRGLAKADGISKTTGLSFLDADKKAIPIYDVIDKIKAKYGHLDVFSRKRVLSKLFGSDEAVRTIDALWDKTDSLRNSIAEISKIKGLDYAYNMANNMTNPLDRLKGLFESLSIKISKKLLPTVELVANSIGNIISKIIDFMAPFPTLNKYIGVTSIIIVGLTGVLSAFLAVVGLFKMIWGGLLMTLAYSVKVYNGATVFIKMMGNSLLWTTGKLKAFIIWSKISAVTTKILTYCQSLFNFSTQKGIFWLGIKNMFIKAHTVMMALNTKSLFVNNAAQNALTFTQIKALAWEKSCILVKGIWNSLLIASKVIMLSVAIPAMILYIGALGIFKGVMLLAQGAVWLFNIAMYANPIGLVVLGVVSLIGVFVACYVWWDNITAAAVWCWEVLKSFGAWIADIFVAYFSFFKSMGSTLFNGMIAGVTWYWNLLKSFGAWIADVFSATISGTLNVFNSLWEGVVSGAKGCFAFIQHIFDNILGIWNSIGGIWDKITGVFSSSSELDATINKTVNLDAPENNLKLSADLVRPNLNHSKSVSNSVNQNTNWGGVNINVAGGMTPGDLAKWGALQA